MAEKNKNSSGHKPSKKMQIINLAGYVNGKANFDIPGLTNHTDKIWFKRDIKHLCHIIKSVSMGEFQIKNFKELKQFVSNMAVPNNEISINEKEKKYLKLVNQLEKEFCDYNLYDILFILSNSVDEDEEFISYINRILAIKNIKEWKECVCYWVKNGEIKPGTWAEWYILSVAKKQGISGEVIKKWKDLMNEAYKLRCNFEEARRRYKICNCLLFEMQNSDESKRLKEDLQWALREESDAYNPPDNLPGDYFLIKGGTITNLDQFIDIMELCIENKVYLRLDMVKFKETMTERSIDKTEFFKMLENATTEQIKKILDIDVKMDKICQSFYNLGGCDSTFDGFLKSSHNSKAIEKIIACATDSKESFLTTFPNVAFNLLDFRHNHLQISVETCEKFLSKCSTFSSWNCGDMMNWVEALSIGLECCSDDMKNNGKKIDLGHIFSDWTVFFKTITNDNSCWEYNYHCVELMSSFFNLLFKNIDNIKLDDKQMVNFLFGFTHSKYGSKVNGLIGALLGYKRDEIENYYTDSLEKIAIVVNAILKKQNLEYEDQDARKCNIQKRFEDECKKIGISVDGDQDGIFFVRESSYSEKLYLVNKNVGVSQFENVLFFLWYVYKNISTKKGQHYAALLGDYICKDNNFSIWSHGDNNYIRDNYFFVICLMLNVLKNHSEAKAKIKRLYIDTLESKWQKFCSRLYSFFVFHFVYVVCSVKYGDVSQYFSTITFDNNKKISQSMQVDNNEHYLVPKIEIDQTNNLQKQG